MVAAGIAMGALVGFITSVQQIFFDVFKLPQLFSYAFAGIAGFMAVGSFFNSRLVERIGARRLSQGSLIIFILLSGVHVAIATAGFENAWSFSPFRPRPCWPSLLRAPISVPFRWSHSPGAPAQLRPFRCVLPRSFQR